MDANPHLILPSINDHMVWLGDFNRHHPLWEDEANEHLFDSEANITPLIDLLYKHDMTLALPKGIPTFQTCAGNWTRPDGVWRNHTPNDPIIRCDTVAAIRPPLANHLPIITILDLPLPRVSAPGSLDFRNGDWADINSKLKARLEERSPAARLRSKEEFLAKVDSVISIIKEVLGEELTETKPSPFSRRWWTKELTNLKRAQNRLSSKSYKLREVRDHPVHQEYKVAVNKFKETMIAIRKQHWMDWLESATQKDIYTANKYLTSEPTDYSSARIPPLGSNTDGVPGLAEDNVSKAAELAKSFFPPPPETSSVPVDFNYPEPLRGIRFHTKARIRQVIKSLSPFKAPGPDKIPNMVYMRCIEALIDHLFFIFRAVFELEVYHPRWLEIATLVLRKIGKTDYDVSKAYRPIGLIDTMPKILSALNINHVSYLVEKHNLLPPTQFGGRPGRNTSDAMLLVVQRIKDAWRSGKVAAALFLDVQGAFPNTVKERLLHDMKARRVPKCFISLTERMLTGRFTQLRFDDFTSEPIPINNGNTQGDPSSMGYYGFYNASLMEIARSLDELSQGFVDDSMLLAIDVSLERCHVKLKDMMERPDGGFDWSQTHNSPLEMSKLGLMNFPRSFRDAIPSDLVLEKNNPDGSTSACTVKTVASYKYLGVIFDPRLRWTLQHAKVLASATFWSSQVWRIAKASNGLSIKDTRQLYNTVSVPGFTYAAEVWYTGLHKPSEGSNMKGLVAITNKLKSMQCKVAIAITGALSSTAGDILDAHANILPIDLLFHKVLFRATVRILSLPASHPLHAAVRKANRHQVKRHRSPLHNLLFLSKLKPGDVETIYPIRRKPNYVPSFTQYILGSKDDALLAANIAHATYDYKVYSDGSGFEGE